GLECPILYSNSAARAGRLGSIAAAAIAVEAATKPRRVILVFAFIFLSSGFFTKQPSSKESNRQPWHRRDQDDPDQKHREIGPDVTDRLVGVRAADGARDVEADAERRREEAHAHRQDRDHRVVDLVHAELPG